MPALVKFTVEGGTDVAYTAFALVNDPVTATSFKEARKTIPLPVLLSLPIVRGEADETAPPVLTQTNAPVAPFTFATKRSEVDCAMFPCTDFVKRPAVPNEACTASVLLVKKLPDKYTSPAASIVSDWPRSPAGAPPKAFAQTVAPVAASSANTIPSELPPTAVIGAPAAMVHGKLAPPVT